MVIDGERPTDSLHNPQGLTPCNREGGTTGGKGEEERSNYQRITTIMADKKRRLSHYADPLPNSRRGRATLGLGITR